MSYPLDKSPQTHPIPSDADEALVLGPTPDRRRRKRVFRIFLAFNLLIIGVLYLFTTRWNNQNSQCSMRPEIHDKGRHSHWMSKSEANEPGDDWSIPKNIVIKDCVQWSDDGPDSNFQQSSSFSLPLDSDKLFLTSTGSYANGNVRVVQSEEAGDAIQVNVTVKYDHPSALERHVKLCQVEMHENENGIGIFTPRWHERHHKTHFSFDVTVTIPAGADGQSLKIPEFITNLALFEHTVADLPSASFEKISLRSAAAGVTVKNLDAQVASIQTSHGAIEGTFNVTDKLVLETANAPIRVNVTLYNEEYAELRMNTANAPIVGVIQLISSKEANGEYKVDAETAHGPLDLDFNTAPVNSTLNLNANTAMGAVDVKLPNTYEGAFKLSTAMSRVQVNFDENENDPEGWGRKRSVSYESHGSWDTKGSTWWAEEGKDRGTVRLHTAMAQVTLNL